MRVIIESPFAHHTAAGRETAAKYLRAAMRECLLQGISPFASHALYTQAGVLDDDDALERNLGIVAGLQWHSAADACFVYMDLGISPGMARGIRNAVALGLPVRYLYLKGLEGTQLQRDIIAFALDVVSDVGGPLDADVDQGEGQPSALVDDAAHE
jgi:hypothetical protein